MTNYTRGRSREYQVMHYLRSRGWVCSRSAMSHGPVDVFAAKAGRVLLIQVKSGSARAKKYELELLKKWAEAFDAEAQVWSFKKRGKREIMRVRTKAILQKAEAVVQDSVAEVTTAVPQILPLSDA